MSAPETPPSYFDLFTGKDVDDPRGEAQFIVESFAKLPNPFGDWIADDIGVDVTLTTVADGRDGPGIVGWSAAGRQGTIEFSVDPSNWVLVVGRFEGREVFRAYLDHVWEQYEFWPAGAVVDPMRKDEAPGRVGKKMHWMSADTKLWPALAPLGHDGGRANFSHDEDKLKLL
jgi:hypothetical protein